MILGQICFFVLFVSSKDAFADRHVGNGGDNVRGAFLLMGGAVIDFLSDTEEGQEIVLQNKWDLNLLKGTLRAKNICVINDLTMESPTQSENSTQSESFAQLEPTSQEGDCPLVPISNTDNGGSEIEAKTEYNKLFLFKQEWKDHYDLNRDVYYLVLHEMLRLLYAAFKLEIYNDEDYRYSFAVKPFKGKKIDPPPDFDFVYDPDELRYLWDKIRFESGCCLGDNRGDGDTDFFQYFHTFLEPSKIDPPPSTHQDYLNADIGSNIDELVQGGLKVLYQYYNQNPSINSLAPPRKYFTPIMKKLRMAYIKGIVKQFFIISSHGQRWPSYSKRWPSYSKGWPYYTFLVQDHNNQFFGFQINKTWYD